MDYEKSAEISWGTSFSINGKSANYEKMFQKLTAYEKSA